MCKELSNELSQQILNAAFEVHRELGAGLLESAYEVALCHELQSQGIAFQRQVEVPVHYKGIALGTAYRLDVLVENLVVVELKSVTQIERIHEAQLLSYLRLSDKWLGLLINFNVPLLKQGIKRIVNN